MGKLRWGALAVAGAIGIGAVPPLARGAEPGGPGVTIRRTTHGIPHIVANDWEGIGYGYGYAIAQDNICVLADTYVTVAGERSKWHGPTGTWRQGGNGTTNTNLESDTFFRRTIEARTIEKLLLQPAPLGPVQEIRDAVRGYAAGYNAYLASVGGPAGITDPACAGKAWVHPIDEMDVYRRFHQLGVIASSGTAINGIGGAAPVLDPAGVVAAQAAQATALAGPARDRFAELLGGIGSNAIGLGKDATADGSGLLLGNPHFPWDGAERFYESHLTIPGVADVAGASLLGVPAINIGFTRNLAWSHTVSTARRFTLFELKLVPGDPYSYLVDGVPEKMRSRSFDVEVKGADGVLRKARRTVHDTRWGPVLTGILGLPLFPWTPTTAYAIGDVNATNFRYLNHFLKVNLAQSVAELDEIERTYQGIPWVNTIAADSSGRAYYADIGAVPNVPDSKIADCSPPLGVVTDRALRVQVLDGSRAACAWDVDESAVERGIIPASRMPSLFRDDYVMNSNDSYWLSHATRKLEGFPRIIGDERTARAPRTRLGFRIIQQRLDGTDGRAGNRFTPDDLMWAVFNNRQYAGEQWRDALVGLCRSRPLMVGVRGPTDVSEACDVLARWNLRDDLDSRGAVLFRRFATRALAGSPVTSADVPAQASTVTGLLGTALGLVKPSPWAQPFDAADPVNTPRGLAVDNPLVQAALADAVDELRDAGIPLDARLREWQYERRGSERIPIHGGPGTVGVFNAINVGWDPARGYPDVPHGSSYVQVVRVTGACPEAHAVLTYSQSTDPTSPFWGDQTRRYSRKQWSRFPFCEDEIASDPNLRVQRLNGGA